MKIAYEPSEVANYQKYFSKTKAPGYKPREVSFRKPEESDVLIASLKVLAPEVECALFDMLMKMEWLFRQFDYNGKTAADFPGSRGHRFDYALSEFWRNNFFFSQTFWNSSYFRVIRKYADDFFPDFDSRDPNQLFLYPYKHMNFESLFFVNEMDDRIKLLEYGEDRKMDYNKFRDYVLACQSKAFKETGLGHKLHKTITFSSPAFMIRNKTLVEEIKQKRL